MKEGANVVELGVPPLENSWLRPWRTGAGWATVMANEALDWLRACTGEEGERGEGEDEKMADFGRPTPLEPGEAEAFRANGLLRTDMASVSRQSSALGTNHGGEMGVVFGVGGVAVCLRPDCQSIPRPSQADMKSNKKPKHAKGNATQEAVRPDRQPMSIFLRDWKEKKG